VLEGKELVISQEGAIYLVGFCAALKQFVVQALCLFIFKDKLVITVFYIPLKLMYSVAIAQSTISVE